MLFEEDIEMTYNVTPDKESLCQLTPEIYKDYRDSNPFNLTKFSTFRRNRAFLSNLFYSFDYLQISSRRSKRNGNYSLKLRLLGIGIIVFAVF